MITAWTALLSFFVFFGLKTCNALRISKEEEEKGMDNVEHGGDAYHIGQENHDGSVVVPSNA